MEPRVGRLKFLLANMGLNEYQASALSYLIFLGETKATTLSKASGVPNARIYGVLEELSQKGLLIIRPGRPAMYTPMTPEEVSEALIADAKEEIRRRLSVIESYRDEFTSVAEEVFLKGGKAKVRPPLLRIVSVGDVSLEETRKLYSGAESSILILTRAMEYFPRVAEELGEAASRGVSIDILMRSRGSLKEGDWRKRDEVISEIKKALGDAVDIRVSDEVTIRGCIVDPERGGRALFLVEEEGVPHFLREAAITSHPGVVEGLASMFRLKWGFDSREPEEDGKEK